VVNPAQILRALNDAGVEYVVIGGVAATLYGCPEQTYDLGILYASTPENRQRLLVALGSIGAEWEEPLTDATLQRQPVFALNTKNGDLDIFTRLPGLRDYAEASLGAKSFTLEGVPAKVLDLLTLIATKEAAADPNPRKQAALAFLKVLQKRTAS
jgi:hypothetical protein